MFRGYDWHDVKPWDYNIYFWGYDIDVDKRKKIRFMDFLQNRYRIFDYNTKKLKFITSENPSFNNVDRIFFLIFRKF